MNKKVYCVYDEDNKVYTISTNEKSTLNDSDVAYELGCNTEQDYENYFNLLHNYNAVESGEYSYEVYYDFKNQSDCQKCVNAINQTENIQELFKDIPTPNTKDNADIIKEITILTKQDILSMPVGKELDRLIYLNIIDNAEKYIKEINRDNYPYPKFSTDISLAYSTLNKMKKELYFSKRKKLMETIQEVASRLSGSEHIIDFSDLLWVITPEAIFKAILILKLGLED